MIQQVLSAMRDVDGVHGSFVISKSGALVGKDLPAMFDEQVLTEVGNRITRLHEALGAGGQDFDACVMRFADHKLHLRSTPHGFLCVLSTNSVNTPALKMALTLTSRRGAPMMSETPLSSPPPAVSSAPPPPVSTQPIAVPASEPPAKRQATYRGRRL